MTEDAKGPDTPSPRAGVERSPNYPSVPLTQAVELAGKLYDREKRTPVAPGVAVKAFGYGALSGTARTVLASLRQYGLIENSTHGVRISDLAMEIIHHPIGSAERTKALKEAATRPPIFIEMAESHADASDDSLRAFLITRRKFSPEGAGRFIPAFREAVQVARLPTNVASTDTRNPNVAAGTGAALASSNVSVGVGSHATATLSSAPRTEPTRASAAAQLGGENMEFVWHLSGDVIATMTVSKKIELDDVDTLVANIEAAKRAIIKQAKANEPKAAPAPEVANDAAP